MILKRHQDRMQMSEDKSMPRLTEKNNRTFFNFTSGYTIDLTNDNLSHFDDETLIDLYDQVFSYNGQSREELVTSIKNLPTEFWSNSSYDPDPERTFKDVHVIHDREEIEGKTRRWICLFRGMGCIAEKRHANGKLAARIIRSDKEEYHEEWNFDGTLMWRKVYLSGRFHGPLISRDKVSYYLYGEKVTRETWLNHLKKRDDIITDIIGIPSMTGIIASYLNWF